MVTLVLLSSVFASTVNAILIGFVLCTFSTLMLLLIKCKTIHGLVLQGVSWTGVSPGWWWWWWGGTAQKKIKVLNMNSSWVLL